MPQTSGSGTQGSPGGWPPLPGPGNKSTEKIVSLSHTPVKRAPSYSSCIVVRAKGGKEGGIRLPDISHQTTEGQKPGLESRGRRDGIWELSVSQRREM